MHPHKLYGGSLGFCDDEERSKPRYLVRHAKLVKHRNFEHTQYCSVSVLQQYLLESVSYLRCKDKASEPLPCLLCWKQHRVQTRPSTRPGHKR
jgi:hypothetical protein